MIYNCAYCTLKENIKDFSKYANYRTLYANYRTIYQFLFIYFTCIFKISIYTY